MSCNGTDLIGKIGAVLASAGADIGAAAEPARHQPGLLELIKRAAHRAPRRVEGEGELALGRQPVALAIGAGLDGAPEIGGDGADAVAAPLQIRRQGFALPSLMRCSVNALHLFG